MDPDHVTKSMSKMKGKPSDWVIERTSKKAGVDLNCATFSEEIRIEEPGAYSLSNDDDLMGRENGIKKTKHALAREYLQCMKQRRGENGFSLGLRIWLREPALKLPMLKKKTNVIKNLSPEKKKALHNARTHITASEKMDG